MDLVLDIGSTETTFAAYDRDESRGRWRLCTDPRRTADEWHLLLAGMIDGVSLGSASVTRVSICSVVPAASAAIREAVRTGFSLDVFELEWHSQLPIRIDLDDPTTVGPDRLANAIAAHHLFPNDTIVVDLGTATTYDCITAGGTFIGGAIAPGARTAAEQLIRRTARLFDVGLTRPERVIGRHTRAALESGIFFAALDAVDGMIRRIRTEWGVRNASVIATGGLASLLAPHCAAIDRTEPDLTLIGIRLAREHVDAGRQR